MSGALWSGIVDVNAPALVTVGVTHTWRDVITHAQTPPHIDRHPHARHDRVGVVGETSVELAMALTAMVHHGLTPVLGHPRWPLALRTAAFARAGVGGPRPASWRPWIDDADSGTVVFTSGSTGVPKAVLHSVAAHRENAAGAHAVMPFGPGDRWLVSLPLCHVGGLALVFRALHAGGALAFPEPGHLLTDALVALRPSHISVVAAQLRQILADPAATAVARAARVVLVGGGPTPASLFAIAVDAGVPVRQTWGLTEMGSQVCTSDALRTATCGVALPGRHVRIADDGELLVGGAPRCIGFVDGWDLQRPFNDAGDYATRDLGVMTAAGLVITGRKDNQFISGGENIQPEAIEAVLSDERVSVVVVPVADEKFGHRPCAFFDASSAMDGGDGADVDVTVELLRRRAVDQLPRFMMPVAWLPMPPFAGLKPSRAALTALAATTLAPTSTTSTPSTISTT